MMRPGGPNQDVNALFQHMPAVCRPAFATIGRRDRVLSPVGLGHALGIVMNLDSQFAGRRHDQWRRAG